MSFKFISLSCTLIFSVIFFVLLQSTPLNASGTVTVQIGPCSVSSYDASFNSSGYKNGYGRTRVTVTSPAGTRTSSETCIIREYDMIAPLASISWNGAPPTPNNVCTPVQMVPYAGFSQISIPTTAYGVTTPILNSIGDSGLKTCGMRYFCSSGSFIDVSGSNNCSCSGGSAYNPTTLLCECPSGTTNVNGQCTAQIVYCIAGGSVPCVAAP